MTVGQRIRDRRKELGLSQDELAKRTGYTSRSSVSKIELVNRGISLGSLEKFAKVLNCSPAYLAGWSEKKEVTS